jgi:WD40 repeat protein
MQCLSRNWRKGSLSRILQSLMIVSGLCMLRAQPPNRLPQPQPMPYSLGFYSGNPDQRGGGYGLQSLVVFPSSGTSYTLRLPFAIGAFDHSVDGKVLYAASLYSEISVRTKTPGAPDRPGLFRSELGSMRMTEVPVNPNLAILALTVSQRQDKLIVSGWLREGGRQTCGLFEVLLPSGATKNVVEHDGCDYFGSWQKLSLSPDGESLLATRRNNLEMIDLRNKSIQSLGKYLSADWSPDGMWIARSVKDGVDLLDPKTLKSQKHISGNVQGHWSPDSRYLIGGDDHGCGSYFYTLVAVDVVTSERTIFASSRCKLNRITTEWVNVERP